MTPYSTALRDALFHAANARRSLQAAQDQAPGERQGDSLGRTVGQLARVQRAVGRELRLEGDGRGVAERSRTVMGQAGWMLAVAGTTLAPAAGAAHKFLPGTVRNK